MGVEFPESLDGRRSTSALGRAVVADALRPVDPAGAKAAEQESNWRRGYLRHFRRLIEAGLPSAEAALSVARGGLGSLHERMRVAAAGGDEAPLASVESAAPAGPAPMTVTVTGDGEAERSLSIPYRGSLLQGDGLNRQLDDWIARGIIEPSCAEAVRAVAAHPEWLALPGRTVVVLGAGAEVGPLPALLSWGANVVGVDLPGYSVWARVLETARSSAGTLRVPVARPPGVTDSPTDIGLDLARDAGLDLAADLPGIADWLAAVDGPLALGNYVYADGAANVRVASAVDALTVRLLSARPDAALAFLATPTDVFGVPPEAVAESRRRFADRGLAAKLALAASGGRMFREAYAPAFNMDKGPGVNDSMIAQQGPNYVLAKRLQRWRATVARHSGTMVSLNVAPPTKTRSVTKNRALAAAYAGAPRFGVEAFDPATTRVLMAALLVHDLCGDGGPVRSHPWQDEAHAAAPGGLWRIPYAPRSALPVAAVIGYPAARRS
ncbi:MAG TPA: hypothetical protein VGI21_00660 [Streptosporangiaceae bacterium]|jgi:hypothetical protein